MSDQKEIVIKLDPTPKPGWPCPRCHGLGHLCDGSSSYSSTGISIVPPTPCSVCKGKGRVQVSPLPD